MSHPDDLDTDATLMDFIEDAIVADTEPIGVLSASELPYACGEWILYERSDGSNDAWDSPPVDRFEFEAPMPSIQSDR